MVFLILSLHGCTQGLNGIFDILPEGKSLETIRFWFYTGSEIHRTVLNILKNRLVADTCRSTSIIKQSVTHYLPKRKKKHASTKRSNLLNQCSALEHCFPFISPDFPEHPHSLSSMRLS